MTKKNHKNQRKVGLLETNQLNTLSAVKLRVFSFLNFILQV